MKILISGGTGQLGRDCTKVLEKRYDVVAPGSKDLDIGDPVEVQEWVERVKPQVILNCAAFTRVDDCETKRDLAWRVNAEGPGHLAAAAHARNSLLVHISTDYVFDGNKPVPEAYTEQEETHPLSHYGMTKLEAERAIARETPNHIMLRTAWMYGETGQNFLKTMLRLALANPEKTIKVVHDQFGSPTWSFRLARQIEKVVEAPIRGIFHATAEGYCTWYELAKRFLEAMEVPHSLAPCTTTEYPTPAVRPRNSILENRRLKEAGLNIMTDWQADLMQFVSLFRDQLIAEVTS